FGEHEFRIVARPLLGKSALHSTAFIERLPGAQRPAFERRRGVPILERFGTGLRPAKQRRGYFVIAFSLDRHGVSTPAGIDLSGDRLRAPYLRRARDRGTSVATRPVLLRNGSLGINVYRPVYRDGAPIATLAECRAALIGFAAGTFRLRDLARV